MQLGQWVEAVKDLPTVAGVAQLSHALVLLMQLTKPLQLQLPRALGGRGEGYLLTVAGIAQLSHALVLLMHTN